MGITAVTVAEWAACALLAAAVATDVRGRRIPNAVPLLLLGLFAVYASAGAVRPMGDIWRHFAIGAVIFAAGFALYMTGRFGAGDTKLFAVAGVWVGPAPLDLSLFLLCVAACSLALVTAALLPFEKSRRMRAELPFALAIAPPAAIVLSLRALSGGT